MKKNKGKMEITVPFFFFILVVMLLAYVMQKYIYLTISNEAEDALAASNLASAIIDIKEYGMTHNIIIADPAEALDIYEDALKYNLNLDEDWKSISNASISGPVEVLEYVVYNVRGMDVEIHYFGEHTYSQTVVGGKGTVTAPNGQLIESTSVYSKITFPVKGLFNIETTALKDKLVDIVRN